MRWMMSTTAVARSRMAHISRVRWIGKTGLKSRQIPINATVHPERRSPSRHRCHARKPVAAQTTMRMS